MSIGRRHVETRDAQIQADPLAPVHQFSLGATISERNGSDFEMMSFKESMFIGDNKKSMRREPPKPISMQKMKATSVAEEQYDKENDREITFRLQDNLSDNQSSLNNSPHDPGSLKNQPDEEDRVSMPSPEGRLSNMLTEKKANRGSQISQEESSIRSNNLMASDKNSPLLSRKAKTVSFKIDNFIGGGSSTGIGGGFAGIGSGNAGNGSPASSYNTNLHHAHHNDTHLHSTSEEKAKPDLHNTSKP